MYNTDHTQEGGIIDLLPKNEKPSTTAASKPLNPQGFMRYFHTLLKIGDSKQMLYTIRRLLYSFKYLRLIIV